MEAAYTVGQVDVGLTAVVEIAKDVLGFVIGVAGDAMALGVGV